MALREQELPRTLHAEEPNPHVDWAAGEIELLTEPRQWARGERPRRAGISSFGISGTNAHLILEEAHQDEERGEGEAMCPPVLPFALSAKTPQALAEAAGRLAAHVEEKNADLLDVAHSLLETRAQLEHRAVVVGADASELLEGLDAVAQGRVSPNLTAARKQSGPLAFLLSGQGSQQPRMGQGLYESFPLYAEAFDDACAALQAEGIDVKAAVFAEPGSEQAEALNRTDLTQASLFAVQVGIFKLVSSFGLKPDYLLGHSIGEIAAIHLAGVLSLQDAAKLVAARGSLMAALPKGGAMASIRASEAEVTESLAAYEGKLTIAAINAPGSVTVSGEEDALREWEAAQQENGKKVRRLTVSHAFHSHRMEPMLAEFEAVASTLSFNAPQLPVISNLTGEPLTEEQATSPAYWSQQIRNAVRFADGVAHLNEQGTTNYLELGPDAILTALAAEALADADAEPTFAAALRREHDDAHSFLLGLGAMHAGGASVDFAPLFAGTGATATELPTYPFQRQRYWIEPALPGMGMGAIDPVAELPAAEPPAGTPSLAERLAGVPDGEREATVLAVVREQIADFLAYPSADAVDPKRNLLELGFDSVGAVQLYKRLAKLAGIEADLAAAFEHPTPAGLAAHLLARLGEGGAKGNGNGNGAGRDGTLRALLDDAIAQGTAGEVGPLLIEISRFRPSFAAAAELEQPAPALPIVTAGDATHLVCLPSFVVGSGPQQFARFARALDGRRPVTALGLPGFRRGEPLPASWEAAVEALAGPALAAAAGEPFALVGFSSGGALAHALAERLEREGAAPAGVALIDSYLGDGEQLADGFGLVMAQLLALDHEAVAIDDEQLLAMGAYMRLFAEWEPGEIAAPGLMLRASAGFGPPPRSEHELAPWQRPGTTVEIAGDHFGLIAGEAALTAEAIDGWLQ
jgi:acyl transferase domain-containing protein